MVKFRFFHKKAWLKVLNVVQKNAKMGQRGTTSSWSEGKTWYLCKHFPVKCEFSFPWTYRTKFDTFSDIDNFSIISKFQFFDNDNFADNLTNADLSAFDKFFPIYRWPLSKGETAHFQMTGRFLCVWPWLFEALLFNRPCAKTAKILLLLTSRLGFWERLRKGGNSTVTSNFGRYIRDTIKDGFQILIWYISEENICPIILVSILIIKVRFFTPYWHYVLIHRDGHVDGRMYNSFGLCAYFCICRCQNVTFRFQNFSVLKLFQFFG